MADVLELWPSKLFSLMDVIFYFSISCCGWSDTSTLSSKKSRFIRRSRRRASRPWFPSDSISKILGYFFKHCSFIPWDWNKWAIPKIDKGFDPIQGKTSEKKPALKRDSLPRRLCSKEPPKSRAKIPLSKVNRPPTAESPEITELNLKSDIIWYSVGSSWRKRRSVEKLFARVTLVEGSEYTLVNRDTPNVFEVCSKNKHTEGGQLIQIQVSLPWKVQRQPKKGVWRTVEYPE